MFFKGMITPFILLIAFSVSMLWLRRISMRGKIFKVRKLPAIDALDELVGRSAELGRPVHFSPGAKGLYSSDSAQTIAGLSVLTYLAKKCVQQGVDIIVTHKLPEMIPILSEIVKEAFVAENKLDQFKPNYNIRFVSGYAFTFELGIMGIFYREKIGANIMIGPYYAGTLMMAESAADVGAMQIGGTALVANLPFMMAACDYTLIGEEMFCAAAYLSNDPEQIGIIAGQDISRIIVVAIIIVGLLLSVLNITAFSELLRM